MNKKTVEKIYKHSSLNWIRTVLRQLVYPSYSSKDAPRPPFSNAPRFISFRQLLMSLRAHLWTVVLKKNHKIRVYASFFTKKIQNVIILIKRRRVFNQLVLPLVRSKDARRPILFEALSLVAFG